jgi:putative membrane protein
MGIATAGPEAGIQTGCDDGRLPEGPIRGSNPHQRSAHQQSAIDEENERMLKILIHWLLSAVALWAISKFLPGFHVRDLQAALIAALVIGLLNATLGLLLKIVTFPITILTLGLFLLVINALMILLAAHLVTGFHVAGWIPALEGAVVLALLGMLIHTGSKKV